MAKKKSEKTLDLEVVTLIAKGLDYTAVAEEMGMNYRQISTRVARRLGMNRPMIRGMAKEGLTPRQILAKSKRYSPNEGKSLADYYGDTARLKAKLEADSIPIPLDLFIERIREALREVIREEFGAPRQPAGDNQAD